MVVITHIDKTNMAETATPLADASLDNASDYGDFGSDAEEVEILDTLLARAASGNEEGQESFVVTDIEDYELPRGILLPKTIIETPLHTSQLESQAETEVLRDIEAENSMYNTFDASQKC